MTRVSNPKLDNGFWFNFSLTTRSYTLSSIPCIFLLVVLHLNTGISATRNKHECFLCVECCIQLPVPRNLPRNLEIGSQNLELCHSQCLCVSATICGEKNFFVFPSQRSAFRPLDKCRTSGETFTRNLLTNVYIVSKDFINLPNINSTKCNQIKPTGNLW